MSTSQIVWGFFFGAIGMGYFMYGKKQSIMTALLSGAALCIFPYFVSSTSAIIITGIILMAIPFLIKF